MPTFVANPEIQAPAKQHNPLLVRPWLVDCLDSVLRIAPDSASLASRLSGQRAPHSA
jgi:hypothetical protein